ncbi:MAG: hypothetical protein Q3976_07785 [Corynebacterium sp.]|nr:hypothetical protein [Corynebacterium sp.]
MRLRTTISSAGGVITVGGICCGNPILVVTDSAPKSQGAGRELVNLDTQPIEKQRPKHLQKIFFLGVVLAIITSGFLLSSKCSSVTIMAFSSTPLETWIAAMPYH